MGKECDDSESMIRALNTASLSTDSGYETIRELLRSDNIAGVLIERRGNAYRIESKTREEYSHIMRAYIAAFPGSLSKELSRKNDDLAQMTIWLREGYTLLLADRGDFVRAYRYVAV